MKNFILFCYIIFEFKFIYCQLFNENIFLSNLKNSDAVQKLYYPFLNETIDLINLVLSDTDKTINNNCAIKLNKIKNGLVNKDKWALLYFESTGGQKNGRLNGDYTDLGHYDQCLFLPKFEKELNFDNKFCLVSINTPEWKQILKTNPFNKYFQSFSQSSKDLLEFSYGKIFGICLPSSCDINSILQSINKVLLPYDLKATSQKYCTQLSKLNEPFSWSEIVSILTFSCTIFFCLLSIFFDKITFLNYFSLKKNFSQIYDYDTNDIKTRSTDYLHGIKAFLVILSILGHCFGILTFFTPFLYSTLKSQYNLKIQFFMDRMFLYADQLFFVSGFFAMFSWYNSIKNLNVTPYKFIFTRFCRVLPVVVMVILIQFLMPFISFGPFYLDLMKKCSTNCLDNFWKNLFFISNTGSFLDMCFMPTWFLSADFQLYLQHYLMIFFLIKKPKIGLWLSLIQQLGNSIFIVLYDYYQEIAFSHVTVNYDVHTFYEMEKHYLPSFYHSNTFTFGVLCAWLVKTEFKIELFRKKKFVFLIYCLAFFCFGIASFIPNLWQNGYIKKNDLFIIIWSVIDKYLVSSLLFAIFYFTSLGYSNLLKQFLSLRIFIPISQLSFSMIMCQFFYFFFITGTLKISYSFDGINILKEWLFAFTVTFLISNITYIFFEAPVTQIFLKIFNLTRRRDILIKQDINTENELDHNDNNLTKGKNSNKVNSAKISKTDLKKELNYNEISLEENNNFNEEINLNNYSNDNFVKNYNYFNSHFDNQLVDNIKENIHSQENHEIFTKYMKFLKIQSQKNNQFDENNNVDFNLINKKFE